MALAIDASTPSIVSGTAAAISTPATSYPAGTFFLVGVGRNGPNASDDDTGTVSGAGLTWALAGRKSSVGATGQISGGSAQPSCFEWWVAYSASALTSVVITDTRASASGTGNEHAMQVIAITGAETTWGGAITANAIAAGTPTCNLTTTRANSWVFAGNSDWAAKGNATVGSSQTLQSQYHLAGQISIHFWRRTATTATSGTVVTMNLTAPTLEQYNMLDIEIREPAGGGGSSLTDNPADNVGVTDSATQVADRVRSQADPVGVTDSVSAVWDRVVTVGDGVGITDGTTATQGAQQNVADPVGVTDSATAVADRVRTQSDPVGVTDSLSVVWDRSATISDGVGATDSTSGPLDRVRSVGDAVGITDSVSANLVGGGGQNQNLADSVGLTDSLSVTWSRVVGIADTVNAYDVMTDLLTQPAPVVYRFETPKHRVTNDRAGSLWRRVYENVGDAVIKYNDGSFRVTQLVNPDEENVAKVYLGGHIHTVSGSEASDLIAAGYGEYLTEMT